MNIRLLLLIILPLVLSSCVSQQKYNRSVDAQARMNLLRQQYIAENERLIAELDSLKQDTVYLAASVDTDAQISIEDNQASLEDELVSKNVEMGQTRGAILNSTARVQQSNTVMTPRMKEIQEEERIINKVIVDIDKTMNTFSAEELNIRVESDGVYITLHENLLFDGANLSVIPRGEQALKQLAKVIKANPNTNIRIEGHIDTPTANSDNAFDSWELSTQRAITVGRMLINENGLSGKRFILAGRGDQLPLAGNQYPMARSLNRRVEIIMVPVIGENIGLDVLGKD